MSDTYRIEDEPVGSRWSEYVVSPVFPFFASMFAGAWVALPWFAFNSVALGSPKRRGDVWLVALTLALTWPVVMAILFGDDWGLWPTEAIPYLLILFVGARIAVCYVRFMRQSQVYELFEWFGGEGRSGFAVIAVGWFARSYLWDIQFLLPWLI
jgi:hypothetical protein